MNTPTQTANQSYQSLYEDFDSPLMCELRRESYGEDIGQHSWVSAEELRRDVMRLRITSASRLLDLGCGPCGPLTFIMKSAGCSGYGIDLSTAALAAGRQRAESLRVDQRLTLCEADLDGPIPLPTESVDSVISLDVVLHLRDRLRAFTEIARVLVSRGRFLFTDAGVVTAAISNEEVTARSMHGFSQFCAPGFNERMLERAGLILLETQDRTLGILNNAAGRLKARLKYQAQLERIEGAAGFARYQHYLRAVISMSERGALSRFMYLAEAPITGPR